MVFSYSDRRANSRGANRGKGRSIQARLVQPGAPHGTHVAKDSINDILRAHGLGAVMTASGFTPGRG